MIHTHFKNQITEVYTNATKARTFLDKYPDIAKDENASFEGFTYRLKLSMSDAALAGTVFGKDGWTREHNRYSGGDGEISFNWKREVDGIEITINSAERQSILDKTTVPPQAFPIMIEDAEPSPTPIDI